jgi:hypothetical protein
MTVHQKMYRLTITTADGQPLCQVLINRERTEPAIPAPAVAPVAEVPAHPNGPVPSVEEDPRMTEPQKRYLFRLLAQQGLDAKAAEGHLTQVLHVATLREVSKTAASQLIEQLITTQKEASHAHA